jgi:hypothetical protein
MPSAISAARRLGVGAAVAALSLVAAGSASAKSVAVNPDDCTPPPATLQPFGGFGDSAFYVLNPGGDMEGGVPGWTLSGGAGVVAGDDGLGVRGGTHVLSLPAGATVVSAPICIDETFPFARLVAQGAKGAQLKVELLYTDTKGRSVVKGSGSYQARSAAWAPTDLFKIDPKLDGAAPVQFRFTAPSGSGFLLDDFYVDPRARI